MDKFDGGILDTFIVFLHKCLIRSGFTLTSSECKVNSYLRGFVGKIECLTPLKDLGITNRNQNSATGY